MGDNYAARRRLLLRNLHARRDVAAGRSFVSAASNEESISFSNESRFYWKLEKTVLRLIVRRASVQEEAQV